MIEVIKTYISKKLIDIRDLVRLKARLAGNKKQSIKWRLMQIKTELSIQ